MPFQVGLANENGRWVDVVLLYPLLHPYLPSVKSACTIARVLGFGPTHEMGRESKQRNRSRQSIPLSFPLLLLRWIR